MLLLAFIYLSLLSFIGISLYRAYQFAKMPMHSRLELYPVPKEAKERAHYGGSFYEELEWWNKPRQTSLAGEIKDMIHEMLFIRKLFDNQRPFWWISYGLHLGIYLLGLWTVLLFVGALTELAGLSVSEPTHWWASLVYYVTLLVGSVSATIATLGSIGLFLRRLSDNTLKKYTTPQEYFNLIFIVATLVTGLLVWFNDPAFNYGRDIAKGLLTFSPIEASSVLTLHILLLGLLLIYIPQSKMSHYVGKYFTFHKVLWDNDPNVPGSQVEEMVKNATSYKPKGSWSAPHFKPAETKTKEM